MEIHYVIFGIIQNLLFRELHVVQFFGTREERNGLNLHKFLDFCYGRSSDLYSLPLGLLLLLEKYLYLFSLSIWCFNNMHILFSFTVASPPPPVFYSTSILEINRQATMLK